MSKTLIEQLNNDSDDDLSEEINDKLSELWTGMKNKRKLMIRNLTPGNSRRSQRQLSSINNPNRTNSLTNTTLMSNENRKINDSKYQMKYDNSKKNNQMIAIQQKLLQQQELNNKNIQQEQESSQVFVKNKFKNNKKSNYNNKQQTLQIKRLKNTINKLTVDNSQLLGQLKQCLRQVNGGEYSQINNDHHNKQGHGLFNESYQRYEPINQYTQIQIRQQYSVENDLINHQSNQLLIDGKTANFHHYHHNNNHSNHRNNQNNENNHSNHQNNININSNKNNINNNNKNYKNDNKNNKSSLSLLPEQQQNINLKSNQSKNKYQNNNIKNNNLNVKNNLRQSKSNKHNNLPKQSSSTKNHKNHTKSIHNNNNNKENINSNNISTTNPSHNQSSKLYFPSQQTLQSLSSHHLIQLLKSTTQYRQFAYYYASHQLSYLKKLQQQHKKNCHINLSQKEKRYWAPTQLIQKLSQANLKYHWGLNNNQLLQIIYEMKTYYEQNNQLKLKQQKDHYIKKIQKLKRQKQNMIPYDLIRLSNAKQRQQSMKKKKKMNTIINKTLRN